MVEICGDVESIWIPSYSPWSYLSFTCHLSGLSWSQVQLQTNGAQAARLEVSRLMGNDQGEKLVGKMGFSQQMLIRMLGEASGRALATIIYICII
jgi:hypothetical protein